jgi:hypothetical protein
MTLELKLLLDLQYLKKKLPARYACIWTVYIKYYIVASCCTFHSITISSLSYVQTLVSSTYSHLKL